MGGLAHVWRVAVLFGVLGLAALGQVQREVPPAPGAALAGKAVLAGDDVKTGGGGMG